MNRAIPEPLPVIFRAYRSGGDVVALFPTLPADTAGALLTCYQHIGQHGIASWGWYHGRTHRPATPEEYAPLLRELRGIYERELSPGDAVFRLVPVRKLTAAHRRAYKKALATYRGENPQ